MLTKTQQEIIALLLDKPEKKFTIRSTARQLHKSYTLTYNNIEDLRKRDLIVKENVPPATIISLNEFCPNEILIEIENLRKNRFIKSQPWINLMLKDILSNTNKVFFTLLVFGSYAKGSQTKTSDIDLLIIVPTKEDIESLENAIRNSYSKVKKSAVIVSREDFIEMIKNPQQLNVGNEAKRYHILLYGLEHFYALLEKAKK